MKFLDTYYSHYISYEVIENLRDDIFRHYYIISPGAVEDIKTGDFIQMIVNDINVFEWFIAHILTEWIAFIFVSVIIIYFVFIKSFVAGIALLSFIFLVVKLFLGTVIQKEEQGVKIKNLGGDLMADVVDGLSGFKELVPSGPGERDDGSAVTGQNADARMAGPAAGGFSRGGVAAGLCRPGRRAVTAASF